MERRLYTAGEAKSRLDPFLPEKPEDVVQLRGLQDQLHEMFREWVVQRRGERLSTGTELFNGEVWTGPGPSSWGSSTGWAPRAGCSPSASPTPSSSRSRAAACCWPGWASVQLRRLRNPHQSI